jgi:hypothetical protein
MMETTDIATDNCPTGFCQAVSACGASHLIGNNLQLITLSMQSQHGEQKISTNWAIHPTRSQNGAPIRAKELLHSIFPLRLALSINTQWVPLLINSVGIPLLTGKNKISAELKQMTTCLKQRF